MRSWLRGLLLLSLISAAVANWWPDTVTHSVARMDDGRSHKEPDAIATRRSNVLVIAATHLPSSLPAIALDRANFDPFVGQQPQAPPAKPEPVPAEMTPPPQPIPTAPALSYRYLGQMVDPFGQRYVYLGKADKELPVAVGTQLDEGYVVEAIAADGVHVHYPPLDTRAMIRIPADIGAALP